MGFGCTICDECLEVPAPAAEYVGTEADLGNPPEEPSPKPGPSRGRGRKRTAAAPKTKTSKITKIRDGTPTDIAITPCGHMFHQLCIARWFKDKNSMNCPACRKVCQQTKLIRAFPTVVDYHPGIDDGFISQPLPPQPPPPAPPQVPAAAAAIGPLGLPNANGNDQVPSNRDPDVRRPTYRTRHAVGIDRGILSSLRIAPISLSLPEDNSPAVRITNMFSNINSSSSDDDDDDEVVRIIDPEPPRSPPAPIPLPVILLNPGQRGCNRPDCQDMRDIHQTLIQDYEELQTKYADTLEEVQIKEVQQQSYDDAIRVLQEEVKDLKRFHNIP